MMPHRHRLAVIPHLREKEHLPDPETVLPNLIKAAADGDIGEVEMLVQSAASAATSLILIRVTMISERLLHLAVGRSLDIVKFLCEAGAEVNVEDRWLRPLMMPTWEVTNHAPRY
jgi:hypothetical protein